MGLSNGEMVGLTAMDSRDDFLAMWAQAKVLFTAVGIVDGTGWAAAGPETLYRLASPTIGEQVRSPLLATDC